MKLPYGDKTNLQQIINKLDTYSLDFNHSSGKHKARLFESKLGITKQNIEVLITAIRNTATTSEQAQFTRSDKYGDRYSIERLFMREIKLHEIVVLKEDIRSTRFLTESPILLCQGQVGTVVDVLGEGAAFEVEFSDLDGQAYAILTIKRENLIPLRYEPVDLLALSS